MTVLVCLGFIPALGVIPWLAWCSDNKLVVSPHGFTCSVIMGGHISWATWSWDQIESGAYEQVTWPEGRFSVRLLTLVGGKRIPFAVTRETNHILLRDLFQLQDKPLDQVSLTTTAGPAISS